MFKLYETYMSNHLNLNLFKYLSPIYVGHKGVVLKVELLYTFFNDSDELTEVKILVNPITVDSIQERPKEHFPLALGVLYQVEHQIFAETFEGEDFYA